MITLENDALVFRFPDIHPDAKLTIDFQRTLRIPDDNRDYPLPAGLGPFPLEHVDDYADSLPPKWLEHGGIMLPMYQSEAMWLNFGSDYLHEHATSYPFAIKIAAGKINAVNGKDWGPGLERKKQNYVVAPPQPWIDGFCVEQGVIRQFVAARLGEGVTVEEQVTGDAEHGGLQIQVFPMKREHFDFRFPKVERQQNRFARSRSANKSDGTVFSLSKKKRSVAPPSPTLEMGMGMGGRMRQQIFDDQFDLSDWDQSNTSRCFVHLANSQAWRQVTGKPAPKTPVTEKAYQQNGIPWFDHYRELPSVAGASNLRDLKTVQEFEEGQKVVREPIAIKKVVRTGDVVRESNF